MVWLPDGEKILKICLFVSTKYTNVMDKQRDRQTNTTTLRIASHDNNLYKICHLNDY